MSSRAAISSNRSCFITWESWRRRIIAWTKQKSSTARDWPWSSRCTIASILATGAQSWEGCSRSRDALKRPPRPSCARSPLGERFRAISPVLASRWWPWRICAARWSRRSRPPPASGEGGRSSTRRPTCNVRLVCAVWTPKSAHRPSSPRLRFRACLAILPSPANKLYKPGLMRKSMSCGPFKRAACACWNCFQKHRPSLAQAYIMTIGAASILPITDQEDISALLLDQFQQASWRDQTEGAIQLFDNLEQIAWRDSPGEDIDIDEALPASSGAQDQLQGTLGSHGEAEILIDGQTRAPVPGGTDAARTTENAAQAIRGKVCDEQLLQAGMEPLHAEAGIAIENLQERQLHSLHRCSGSLKKGGALCSR